MSVSCGGELPHGGGVTALQAKPAQRGRAEQGAGQKEDPCITYRLRLFKGGLFVSSYGMPRFFRGKNELSPLEESGRSREERGAACLPGHRWRVLIPGADFARVRIRVQTLHIQIQTINVRAQTLYGACADLRPGLSGPGHRGPRDAVLPGRLPPRWPPASVEGVRMQPPRPLRAGVDGQLRGAPRGVQARRNHRAGRFLRAGRASFSSSRSIMRSSRDDAAAERKEGRVLGNPRSSSPHQVKASPFSRRSSPAARIAS